MCVILYASEKIGLYSVHVFPDTELSIYTQSNYKILITIDFANNLSYIWCLKNNGQCHVRAARNF